MGITTHRVALLDVSIGLQQDSLIAEKSGKTMRTSATIVGCWEELLQYLVVPNFMHQQGVVFRSDQVSGESEEGGVRRVLVLILYDASVLSVIVLHLDPPKLAMGGVHRPEEVFRRKRHGDASGKRRG